MCSSSSTRMTSGAGVIWPYSWWRFVYERLAAGFAFGECIV
jgi:hypothetical protein